MLVCKFVCIASAFFCMYACMYASALLYVDACMYCACFVLCVCLYVSLYVSWGGGMCIGWGAPPSIQKKLRQNYYYVEGIDRPYLRFDLLTV